MTADAIAVAPAGLGPVTPAPTFALVPQGTYMAAVRVRAPGAMTSATLRLYLTTPGGAEALVAEQALTALPFADLLLAVPVTVGGAGSYNFRAEIAAASPNTESVERRANVALHGAHERAWPWRRRWRHVARCLGADLQTRCNNNDGSRRRSRQRRHEQPRGIRTGHASARLPHALLRRGCHEQLPRHDPGAAESRRHAGRGAPALPASRRQRVVDDADHRRP